MILAFDTATDWLTVSLGKGNAIAAEYNGMASRAHLGRLLPTIDLLLKQAHMKISDISHLAVGVGPGSFTGARIGVSTAQGLAHSLEKPLIGISTLDVIAAGVKAGPGENIFPILDAKRKEVYSAIYDSSAARQSEYWVMGPADLSRAIADSRSPYVLAGDGLTMYADILGGQIGAGGTVAQEELWRPSARVLIQLAEEKINQGQIGAYYEVLPIYIRQSDAEENLKRKKSS